MIRKSAGGQIVAPRTVFDKIDEMLKATPNATLTTTGAGDLQTAINSLQNNQLLEIKTNSQYSPIILPADKAIKVRVAHGYKPSLAGQECIKIPNGAKGHIVSGLYIAAPSPGNPNYQGAAITFAAHRAIVEDIIFHDITIDNVTGGSAVMLSYHWTADGDTYFTANLPEENSKDIALVDCAFYKGCKDGVEGAGITLRGVDRAFIYNCYFNNDGQDGRGIQLQNCRDFLIEKNRVYNFPLNNGEGIKIDMMGSCTFPSTGKIRDCRVKNCIEGIDVDDNVVAHVYRNRVSACSASGSKGISLDDSSRGYFELNECWDNYDGIRCEAGSVSELKNNVCYSNTNQNYRMDNGYVPDASNLTAALE